MEPHDFHPVLVEQHPRFFGWVEVPIGKGHLVEVRKELVISIGEWEAEGLRVRRVALHRLSRFRHG